MALIALIEGVSFEFPNGREIFTNLNLSLETKVYGLVGPNGVGKTSLAKLLTGELEPTSGVIRRRTPVTFFKQRQDPTPVTVQDFLGPQYEYSNLTEQLLEGVERNALCTTLSGGQWMRVRLAQTLNERFLILDEPTNDLDRDGRNALMQFIRGRTGGALLISHDRECLGLCEQILELSNHGLAKYGGGWSDYKEARDKERERLSRALDVAKTERDSTFAKSVEQKERQERRSRRGAQTAANGGMPRILLGARKRQAQVTSGKIHARNLAQTEKSVHAAFEAYSELKIDPVMYADLIGSEIPSQKLVAEAVGYNVRFHDWIYKCDLEFSWRGNVRVALKGANGSGKSTLLKALLGTGNTFDTRGELRRGDLKTLYIDQRCATLDDAKSVLENVRENSNRDESDIRNGLAKFLFTKDSVFQTVRDLSGGERLRAALAKSFLSEDKPNLLVLDEPTNNLDLMNIEFLENLVRQFRGALIVVSHDEVFLENCDIAEELFV